MVRTFGATAFPLEHVLAAKGGHLVTVCIPAHNEAPTVAGVVDAVAGPHLARRGGSGLVDEVLVVDDGSSDSTAEAAVHAGARVHRLGTRAGKGGAMQAGVEVASGDVLVFLDADVENTTGAFVTSLLGALFDAGADGGGADGGAGGAPAGADGGAGGGGGGRTALVKGYYARPLGGSPTGGGRVNELMARPVLDVLFPHLADVRQPLAGETATHRWVLEKVGLAPGYGVEMALLLDVAAELGADAIAQVDLGTRVHRNRPLDELRPMAVEVFRAAWSRAPGQAHCTPDEALTPTAALVDGEPSGSPLHGGDQ